MKWGYKSKAWLLLFLTLVFVFIQWAYSAYGTHSARPIMTYDSYGVHHYEGGLFFDNCFSDGYDEPPTPPRE